MSSISSQMSPQLVVRELQTWGVLQEGAHHGAPPESGMFWWGARPGTAHGLPCLHPRQLVQQSALVPQMRQRGLDTSTAAPQSKAVSLEKHDVAMMS